MQNSAEKLGWRTVREVCKGVVWATAFGLVGSDVVGHPARVEGASMKPLLHGDSDNDTGKRDWIFLSRWAVRSYEIQRGDVIVFRAPKSPERLWVKRVIGIEGDLIRTLSYKKTFVRVPEGRCWVEGENQKTSLDSNSFGPLPVGLVYAKATHIIWPPSRWQRIDVSSLRKPVKQSPFALMSTLDDEDLD